MRYEVEPYRTPEGFTDFPFTYVFDATGLTDGININNLSKSMQGDSDFILRHVVGADTVVDTPANGGKIQLYNGSKSKMTQAAIIAPKSFPIVPEKRYRYNEEISFDLVKTLRSFNACGGTPIFTSYIGFRGVKRFAGNPGYRYGATPYAWREVPQVYTIDITVNFARFASGTNVNPPQRFVVPLDNYDFELFQTLVSQPGTLLAGGGTASAVGLTTNDFGITLYDGQGSHGHQLSDLPQPVLWVSGSKPTAATQQRYQAVVPVPPLVYPAAGQIVFDVTSFLCSTSLPQNYNIAFYGVWRVPCATSINTLKNASQITARGY